MANVDLTIISWVFLLSVFLMISTSKLFLHKRKKFPGPLGYPIVGNLFQLREGHAKKLAEWTTQYGGIFRLVLGNREAIVLSTRAAVIQTIVQKGTAFQSRPEFNLSHIAFSIETWGHEAPSTLGGNDNVRRYRKLLKPEVAADKLKSYNNFFSYRYYRLLGLLSEISSKGVPSDLGFCIWTTVVGITTDQLVGRTVDEETIKAITDSDIKNFRERRLGAPLHNYFSPLAFAKRITEVILSLFLTSHLPRLPAWLGDNKMQAKVLPGPEVDYCTQLLQELHQRLDCGDETPSILGDLIRGHSAVLNPNDEVMMTMTLAGSGVTVGTTLVWLTGKLAMLPEIQDGAFTVLKSLYGDRFPDPLDTDRVEYIKALGLEARRFWAPVRLGLHRETYEDVIVDGVLIPEGTLVICNSFQINRDPLTYDFPDEFRPERWTGGKYGCITSAVPKIGVPDLTHGAGNRICMGIPITNAILYGTLTLLLYFFKLERAPLSEAAKSNIFPEFRAVKEASLDMDPLDDQMDACDAHAIPGYVGVRLTARDPDALRQWLAERQDFTGLQEAFNRDE